MIAQKTPPTALTLSFNETWNSLYFQELSIIRIQLFEDYTLRFLILNYLNYRRYWLYKFSVKKTTGFYFIGVRCLSPRPSTRFKALKPTRVRLASLRYGYRQRFRFRMKRYSKNKDALIVLKVHNYVYRLFHRLTNLKQLSGRYQIWLKLKKKVRLYFRRRLWKTRKNNVIKIRRLRQIKQNFKRRRRWVKKIRRRFRRFYKRYKRKYRRILIIKFRKRTDLNEVIYRQRRRYIAFLRKQNLNRKQFISKFKFGLTKVQQAHLLINRRFKKSNFKNIIALYGLKLLRQTGLRRFRLHKRIGRKRLQRIKRVKLLKRRCRRFDYTIRRFMRKFYKRRKKHYNRQQVQNSGQPKQYIYRPRPLAYMDDFKKRHKRIINVLNPNKVKYPETKRRKECTYRIWNIRKKVDLAARRKAWRHEDDGELRTVNTVTLRLARKRYNKSRRPILLKQMSPLRQLSNPVKGLNKTGHLTPQKLHEINLVKSPVTTQSKIKRPAGNKPLKTSLRSKDKRFFSTMSKFNKVTLKQYKFTRKNTLLIKRQSYKPVVTLITKNKKRLRLHYNIRVIKYKNALYNPLIRFKIRKYIIYIQAIFKKFFKRKIKNWRIIIFRWMRKWGHKHRFIQNWRRRLASFSFVKIATERTTNSLCFFQFQIRRWKYRSFNKFKYKANLRRVPKALAIQLLITTFFAIKKGSPLAIIDLLRRLLRGRYRHFRQLQSFSRALRFWLVDKSNGQVKANNLCQGVKIEVIGKIDGSDRTRTWRYMLGKLPTSDFRQNFQYEQSIIATKYGILHLHVWLYFQPLCYHQPTANQQLLVQERQVRRRLRAKSCQFRRK